MPLETVALAILSGGFVGVVYKSRHEYSERLRERQYEAADRFLNAAEKAMEALEEGAQSIRARRGAVAAALEGQMRLEARIAPGAPVAVAAHVKEALSRAPRALAALDDALDAGQPPAQAFDEALEAVKAQADELVALDSYDGTLAAKEVFDFCRAIRDVGTSTARGMAAGTDARIAVERLKALRPRLSLVYSGQANGDVVLARANEATQALVAIRDGLADRLSTRDAAQNEAEVQRAASRASDALGAFAEGAAEVTRSSWFRWLGLP